MKKEFDMLDIIKKLRSRKQFSDTDLDKLLKILKSSEIEIPEAFSRKKVDISQVWMQGAYSRGERRGIPRWAWWSAIPAFAAVCIAVAMVIQFDLPIINHDHNKSSIVHVINNIMPLKNHHDVNNGTDALSRKQIVRDVNKKESLSIKAPYAPEFLIYAPETGTILTIGGSIVASVKSHRPVWAVECRGRIATLPVKENTILYVSTTTGYVMAVDIVSGTIKWNKLNGMMRPGVRLALDATGIFCATSEGVLYKYNKKGVLQWKYEVGNTIKTTPAIIDKIVFVPLDNELHGIDSASGIGVIKYQFSSQIVSLNARPSQGNVYITTESGRLYCYNYKNDEIQWEYAVDDKVAGDVIIENNAVYVVGRAGKIYRFNSFGKLIWNRNIGDQFVKRPSDDTSNIYITSEKTFFVIDKNTGQITWSLLVPQITTQNVVVSSDEVYFGTEKTGITMLKKQ